MPHALLERPPFPAILRAFRLAKFAVITGVLVVVAILATGLMPVPDGAAKPAGQVRIFADTAAAPILFESLEACDGYLAARTENLAAVGAAEVTKRRPGLIYLGDAEGQSAPIVRCFSFSDTETRIFLSGSGIHQQSMDLIFAAVYAALTGG